MGLGDLIPCFFSSFSFPPRSFTVGLTKGTSASERKRDGSIMQYAIICVEPVKSATEGYFVHIDLLPIP